MREELKYWKAGRRQDVPAGHEKGLTLSELLVLLAIIACSVLVLLPAIFRAREYAGRLACADNLRKIGGAAIAYARDFGGYLPSTSDRLSLPTRRIRGSLDSDSAAKPGLGKLLKTKHLLSPGVLGCPSSSYARPSEVKLNWSSGGEKVDSAYLYRGEGGGSSLEIESAMPALVMDFNISDFRLYNHKGEKVNILFTDVSVEVFSDSGLLMDRKISFEVYRVFSLADSIREGIESE